MSVCLPSGQILGICWQLAEFIAEHLGKSDCVNQIKFYKILLELQGNIMLQHLRYGKRVLYAVTKPLNWFGKPYYTLTIVKMLIKSSPCSVYEIFYQCSLFRSVFAGCWVFFFCPLRRWMSVALSSNVTVLCFGELQLFWLIMWMPYFTPSSFCNWHVHWKQRLCDQ